MDFIRNDITKQNGGCSVGKFVFVPMEIVRNSTQAETVGEVSMDHAEISVGFPFVGGISSDNTMDDNRDSSKTKIKKP